MLKGDFACGAEKPHRFFSVNAQPSRCLILTFPTPIRHNRRSFVIRSLLKSHLTLWRRSSRASSPQVFPAARVGPQV